MLIYSNTYSYSPPIYSPQQGNMNSQEYYENEENHGSYVYITLENLVNNYWQNMVGDSTILGNRKRHQILFWMKKGIQQFTMDVLREVKAVELELGDTLDVILPPDYLNYVRVSWVNEKTGDLMPMQMNRNLPLAKAYLQDNLANILFDDNGDILIGTTAFNEINDHIITANRQNVLGCGTDCTGCNYYGANCPNPEMFRLDTSKNHNGQFNIDTRQGRIHFTSQNASRIIMLEYISDGLEYSNESDVKVNKMAEMALYAYVTWNLSSLQIGVQEYIVNRYKKDFDTKFRNCKIKMMNLKIPEIVQALKERNKWFK